MHCQNQVSLKSYIYVYHNPKDEKIKSCFRLAFRIATFFLNYFSDKKRHFKQIARNNEPFFFSWEKKKIMNALILPKSEFGLKRPVFTQKCLDPDLTAPKEQDPDPTVFVGLRELFVCEFFFFFFFFFFKLVADEHLKQKNSRGLPLPRYHLPHAPTPISPPP